MKFEDYNKSGKENNRRINEPSSFKKAIYIRIDKIKKENKELFYCMKMAFLMNHANAHKRFLMENMEEEPNYYRAYSNIEKCKSRCAVEILNSGLSSDNIEISLFKDGKKNEHSWKIILTIKEDNLVIVNEIQYVKIKDYLNDKFSVNEIKECKEGTFLTDRELNEQQYFEFPLRKALNELDRYNLKLIKEKN